MRIFSAKKLLNATAARNSFLINQLATPGLGSLMAGRWAAGIGQIILAVAGFGLIVAWFFLVMSQFYHAFKGDEPSGNSVAGFGEAGALLFAAAWLWALFTSLSLMREARENEAQTKAPC